jgi:hypothetical protein
LSVGSPSWMMVLLEKQVHLQKEVRSDARTRETQKNNRQRYNERE